jgi:TraM recognition site of TraD and TraG
VLITQSYAQLKQRWDADGAAVIWQCCKTKVIYGAATEDELCTITERACGTVRVRTTERDHRGLRRGHEAIPLLPGAMLRMLPAGRAVVIQGRAAPVIVRIEQVRRRADYKCQHTRSSLVALPSSAPRQLPTAMPGFPGYPPPGIVVAAQSDLTGGGDRRGTVP